MGLLIKASATQSQPTNAFKVHVDHKGIVYVNAQATGTGTWTATFNVAAVTENGDIGNPRTFSISNSSPKLDQELQTGVHSFIGWWTITGTANAVGTVAG